MKDKIILSNLASESELEEKKKYLNTLIHELAETTVALNNLKKVMKSG